MLCFRRFRKTKIEGNISTSRRQTNSHIWNLNFQRLCFYFSPASRISRLVGNAKEERERKHVHSKFSGMYLLLNAFEILCPLQRHPQTTVCSSQIISTKPISVHGIGPRDLSSIKVYCYKQQPILVTIYTTGYYFHRLTPELYPGLNSNRLLFAPIPLPCSTTTFKESYVRRRLYR